MKNFLLDLLFPKSCLGCKSPDTWLCDGCFSLIRPNQTQRCYVCRKPELNGRTCSSHLRTGAWHVSTLDGLLIAAHYDGNPILKRAITALKYNRNHQELAEKLGRLIKYRRSSATSLRDVHCEIIPVPLHPNRLKSRGFNHAELLAGHLGKDAKSCVSTILIRTRDTLPQVQCSDRQTRLNNPKGAFALNGKIDPEKTYILVDDLITTGATLEECCKVLKENGAKIVWGLVLARN